MKNIVLIIVTTLFYVMSYAQDAKHYSLQISPGGTWITTDDHLINSNGGLMGAVITGKMERQLKGNLYYTKGIALAFGQGGTLRHEVGGNLLPTSDLENSEWNNGQKPLSDGTDITYKLRMLEIPLGIKYRIQTESKNAYFIEPTVTPQVRWSMTGAIGNDQITAVEQDLRDDTRKLNAMWGIGIGIEHGVNQDFALIAGLSFHRGIRDLTKNKGIKTPTSTEGVLGESVPENSKAQLNAIRLSFGIIF